MQLLAMLKLSTLTKPELNSSTANFYFTNGVIFLWDNEEMNEVNCSATNSTARSLQVKIMPNIGEH